MCIFGTRVGNFKYGHANLRLCSSSIYTLYERIQFACTRTKLLRFFTCSVRGMFQAQTIGKLWMNFDHHFQWFVKAKRLRSWSDWSKFPRFYTAIQQPSDQLRIRRIRTALNVSESRNWKYLVSTIVMVRLEPENSERRIRGNYEMGNENILQLKFAVVVVFFKWNFPIFARFSLGRNILSQWLNFFLGIF